MEKNHHQLSELDRKDMNFSMRLSFIAGLFLLFIKTYAFFLTGSAAILSDAAESIIHVFAVGFAAYSMWLSFKPADHDHLYGHDKISFFSAGFEGAMIIIAALFILYESVYKLIFGFEITNIDSGVFFIVLATVINLFLSLYLIRKGKKYKSIILEANGKHILTDCWTSIGVILALVLVWLTGIDFFDPALAILIALNILWTGGRLIKRSVSGLMDEADKGVHKEVVSIIEKETKERHLHYHNLRHRLAGHKIFIELHLLFPQDINLYEAHLIATEIEANTRAALDRDAEIVTHLEPLADHDATHKKYGIII